MINCEGHIFSVAAPAGQQASYDRGGYAAGRAPGLHSQNRPLEGSTEHSQKIEKKKNTKKTALDTFSVVTPTS